jgi:ABC-type uncharacterized transport system permease subunit
MKQRTIEFIILSGWALLMLVCIVVIGAAVTLWILGKTADESLVKMALMAMSFLFGSLPSMVKDLLTQRETP